MNHLNKFEYYEIDIGFYLEEIEDSKDDFDD